jgi:hypothetical protein
LVVFFFEFGFEVFPIVTIFAIVTLIGKHRYDIQYRKPPFVVKRMETFGIKVNVGFDEGSNQFDNFNCIGINIFKLFVGKIIFLWRNLQYK